MEGKGAAMAATIRSACRKVSAIQHFSRHQRFCCKPFLKNANFCSKILWPQHDSMLILLMSQPHALGEGFGSQTFQWWKVTWHLRHKKESEDLTWFEYLSVLWAASIDTSGQVWRSLASGERDASKQLTLQTCHGLWISKAVLCAMFTVGKSLAQGLVLTLLTKDAPFQMPRHWLIWITCAHAAAGLLSDALATSEPSGYRFKIHNYGHDKY